MNRSNEPSKRAHVPDDGTLQATVLRSVQHMGRYHFLELAFPSVSVPESLFGKFVLARCAPSWGLVSADSPLDLGSRCWDIYLRRPMFPIAAWPLPDDSADQPHDADGKRRGFASALRFLLPNQPDPGFDWLVSRPPGDRLNLTGYFGRKAELNPHARRLLLLSSVEDAPLLIPLADQMLDQGGRVAFIVRGSPSEDSAKESPEERPMGNPPGSWARAFVSLLPISVEVHFTESGEDFQRLLGDAIPWSDSLAANESAISPHALAQAIQLAAPWVRPQTGRAGTPWAPLGRPLGSPLGSPLGPAYFLVKSDLVCGFGACMACVVQRMDGSLTRACVRGPAFPLHELIGN